MRIAFLVDLPEDVERFEPVARRIEGADLLLGEGRWVPPSRDSREATRRCARRRGWSPVEDPGARFDLVVASSSTPVRVITCRLAAAGRIVLWHDPGARSSFVLPLRSGDPSTFVVDPAVAAIHAAHADDVTHFDHVDIRIDGDPRWDALGDRGAATRARHALGLSGSRPTILVWLDAESMREPWARALAALRAEHDLILRPCNRAWFGRERCWPRALTGPGMRVVRPDDAIESAELLALADLVVSAPSIEALAAMRWGRRVLLIDHAPHARRAHGATHRAFAALVRDRPVCIEPAELRSRCAEASALSVPARVDAMDGRAADRLAASIARIREGTAARATTLRR